MSDKFTLDVVQAAELKYAFERNGFTNADVKKMSSGDLLAQLLPVVRGQAEVTMVAHVIDCDAAPLIPYKEWTVEEHQKGGQFTWDPSKVSLYLSEHQCGDWYIEGTKLRKELTTKSPLNANALDYLLRHPHLILEDWKVDERGNTRYIYFWATVYRNASGSLCVRCVYFDGGHWQAYYDYVGNDFYCNGPAAVRVSE